MSKETSWKVLKGWRALATLRNGTQATLSLLSAGALLKPGQVTFLAPTPMGAYRQHLLAPSPFPASASPAQPIGAPQAPCNPKGGRDYTYQGTRGRQGKFPLATQRGAPVALPLPALATPRCKQAFWCTCRSSVLEMLCKLMLGTQLGGRDTHPELISMARLRPPSTEPPVVPTGTVPTAPRHLPSPAAPTRASASRPLRGSYRRR